MRFNLFSILAIVILITSCSRGTTDDQASDSLAAAADTTGAANTTALSKAEPSKPCGIEAVKLDGSEVDPVFEDSLKKYFTPEQIITLRKAKKQFDNIKTAEDMAAYYPCTLRAVTDIVNTQISVMTPTETSGDNSPDPSWRWFSDYYPGFSGSVECSECSYDMKISHEPLLEKAAQTSGNEDDIFFDLAETVYEGPYSIDASIFNSTGWYELVGCDFCDASLLGSNKRYTVLVKIERGAAARKYFGYEMDKFQEAATMAGEDHFYDTKQHVIDEINLMLKVNILTPEEKTGLNDLIQKINSGQVQVNCQENCEWPEY